jgi:hypothetical protein
VHYSLLALARVDGYGYALVAEDGSDLQATAERLDIGAQGGEVDLAAGLQAGDVALGYPELNSRKSGSSRSVG